MKAEFELNIDRNGKPCIKFRHYDKENSLEQKTLKVLIDGIKENGIQLVNTSGYIDGNGGSWENYELQIKPINK